jgi:hypothetical protein
MAGSFMPTACALLARNGMRERKCKALSLLLLLLLLL